MKKLFLVSIIILSSVLNGCKKSGDASTVVPIAPSNLTATAISTTQINLSWIDNSTNESGFKVERKSGVNSYSLIATVGANVTIYSDSGLTHNTIYTYRVYAINSAGNSLSYSNEATATTSGTIADSVKIGLIAWYPFTGNAKDSSGNNNDGTVYGAVLTTDRFGNANNAYSFNGSSYIEVPYSSTMNLPNGTISFWFRTNQSTLQLMLYKTVYGTAANENYAVAMEDNSLLDFYVKYNSGCIAGSGWQHCIASNTYSDGNYHHLLGTISSDSLRMYVDGIKIVSKLALNSSADTCSPSSLFIGRDWATNQLYNFNGSLDDVRLYNRILSEQEITYLATH